MQPNALAFSSCCGERIFAFERDGADQIFNLVWFDLDAAIGQECLQPVPVIVDIGKLLSQVRLYRLRLKPFLEGRHCCHASRRSQ